MVLLLSARSVAAQAGIWLDIDTSRLTLKVMEGERTVQAFENIAIGSNGPTREKRRGDEKTPLGQFEVVEIRDSERFLVFIAINYPTPAHVQRGCQSGTVSTQNCEALKNSAVLARTPPQDTGLGGHIGIHGLGRGDRSIHENFNWTNGCIALTNEQLVELLKWVVPGTPVSIY